MNFLYFLLTLAAALALGIVGHKLKLPAGAMVGGIVGVVVVNLTVGRSFFYSDIKIVLQILSGVMIGSKIGRKDLHAMKAIVLPTLFLLGGMVIPNLGFGGAIYRFSSLDVPTALFATAPGGMADMALISSDLGANPAYVGILQLIRVLTIFIFMPPLFKRILQKRNPPTPVETEPSSVNTQVPVDTSFTYLAPKEYIKRFLPLVAAAAAGGLICHLLGVAAGALTGSMVLSAAMCVWKGTLSFPGRLRFFMQVFSGAFIGVGIDRACIASMPELLSPVIIMVVGIFIFVFVTSFLMHRIFKLDLAVCLLSSTPGGVQEMSLLSEDLMADTPKVAVMQTTRLMCVILLFPTMLRFITLMFR